VLQSADRLLAGLDENQRAVVTDPRRPLAIVAGPGAGKTRVLTTRVAWRIATGEADPGRTLVVTFTRRAAGELRTRLRDLGLAGPDQPTVSTLHALAAATLQRTWREAGEPVRPIAPYPLRLLAPLCHEHPGPLPDPRTVAGEISWAKARAIRPDTYPATAARAGRIEGWGDAARFSLSEVFAAYEELKARRGVLDVDDLVPALTARMAADKRLAERIHWHHRHLYVDEFQDLGRAAFRLVRSLAGPGDEVDLTVVGDADQAVYGFAGSDPRLLLRLDEALEGTATVHLRRSHRVPPAVLASARAVLAGCPTDPAAVLADATRPPTDRPVVTAGGHPAEQEEAQAIAWALRCEHGAGRRWSQLAVLARTNARLDAVAAACEAAGVPTRSRRCILDRPEVRNALDALQVRPPNLPAATCRAVLRQVAADALDNPELMAPARRALSALVGLADEYASSVPGGTLDGFLAWLDGTVRADGGEPAEAGDAVDILTFHRAKGLEWDVVHLVGMESGVVPWTTDPTGIAEERRLVYVALTRAREAVHCSWVGAASPWLRDAVEAASRLAVSPVPPPAALVARHRMGQPTPDPALVALRRWRDQRARAFRVDRASVLADVVLERIAQARPSTLHDLAAVHGVGAHGAQSYGQSLLAALAHVAA
jgi:DNA helicase-2/ATP-dependent DNA helicase PcrA